MATIQVRPPFPPTWLIWLIAILLIALAALNSCNPQRRIDKAVMLTQSDSTAMQKMRAIITRLYPCIPLIGKPGQTITVTQISVDTAAITAYKLRIDSLLNITTDTTAIKAQLLAGYKPQIITIYQNRVDTIADARAIALMQERYDALKQYSDNLDGQYMQQGKTIAENNARQKRGIKWHLIATALLVAAIGVRLYLKFKP
jgi:hypothetical protein